MFLRCHKRQKNGRLHRYWSVIGVARGELVQRQVLYLGEISDRQESAWRRMLSVFDERTHRHQQLALFPSDAVIDDARVAMRCPW